MYVSWYVNTVEPPLKENVSIFNTVRDGCIAIITAQSIPSVSLPPKASFKCWHLLWLSTSELERTNPRL